MKVAAAESNHKGRVLFISLAMLVSTGLLAVAWGTAHVAGASAPVGTSDKSSGQTVRAQTAGHLPFFDGGDDQPMSGQAPTATAGSGGPAEPSFAFGSSLPGLGGHLPLQSKGGIGSEGSATGGTGAAPAVVATPACSPNWEKVSTPNASFQLSNLQAVAEVGPNDVWAGGVYYTDAALPKARPFFEHWDGTSWTPVAAVLPVGGTEGGISDIAVSASNDIWAVGSYSDGTTRFELIERWNGIQWSPVPGPHPSATENGLGGVVVVSTNNVWAVGSLKVAGVSKTLIEHWDGSAWSQVVSPSHGTGDNALYEISMVPGSSGNDMWAVGTYDVTPSGTTKALTLHYDGTSWSYVDSPSEGANNTYITGAAAISANDVWIVGGYVDGTIFHTLAEHWNGSAWSISHPLNPNADGNQLIEVFATSANNVWAAGPGVVGTNYVTLIEHWNGSSWSVAPNTDAGAYSATWAIGGGGYNDIWAVGVYMPTLTATGFDVLTEHYNGADWSQVYAPDPPTGADSLYSVSAVSANDIWAVGYARGHVNNVSVRRSIIEHWDGTQWSIVTSPHPGTQFDQLYSVKAVSANDVWAVGSYSGATHEQTFIAHWNGTAWSQITSPNPGGAGHDNSLSKVDAASASDAWAVGFFDNGTASQTLILHWNGIAWLQSASLNPGAYSDTLSDVAIVPNSGGNDVWVTGYYQNNSADKAMTLFERWDGTSWSVVSSPNISGVDNQPAGLFALSANDVWAVGSTYDVSALKWQNLALHWNGINWSISSVVQQGPDTNVLFNVAGTSSNDVYAVGVYFNASGQQQALMEHWNGTTWSVLPNIPSPGLGAALADMEIVSSTDMWAVGFQAPAGFSVSQTLAVRYHPCLVSCSITFSDVPVGSTFYPYIHCLACMGIINGYQDGTFKPNANVTRGQLSKIVANSAGLDDDQPLQMFQDVPLGSTFQVYIGRLAYRGYINGYPCGGAGEACVPPGNLPYFRPNNNATRGQISKIVSNAAGFNDAPSGQQFQDVAVGSTYYAYIYRLVSRGVMSGYPCGGAGEPCGPGNLPYFRPNNNATRGQTSKIVSGTFFPDCTSPGSPDSAVGKP